MLQDNVERYRKEIASLREKEQKTAAAAQKHEQTIHSLNEDLRAAKEKLSMAEVCLFSSNLLCVQHYWGNYKTIENSLPLISGPCSEHA